MNIMSFDEAFFKYYTDNRSAISDTWWRTNVRAWKTRALELLSVSALWQSFSLLVNHNVKSVWFQILSERTWSKRERSLDSTRPAIRTADSTLALRARLRRRETGDDWFLSDAIAATAVSNRTQATRKRTNGPIKIDLVLKPALSATRSITKTPTNGFISRHVRIFSSIRDCDTRNCVMKSWTLLVRRFSSRARDWLA